MRDAERAYIRHRFRASAKVDCDVRVLPEDGKVLRIVRPVGPIDKKNAKVGDIWSAPTPRRSWLARDAAS